MILNILNYIFLLIDLCHKITYLSWINMNLVISKTKESKLLFYYTKISRCRKNNSYKNIICLNQNLNYVFN